MTNVTAQAARRRAAGRPAASLLCICLFVQPLAVHWHLASHEHTYARAGRSGALVENAPGHSHAAGVAHAPPRSGSQRPGPAAAADAAAHRPHAPHPATDHVAQLQARQSPPPAHDLQPLAVVPGPVVEMRISRSPSRLPARGQASPRAPPWRAAQGPRAPPAAT